MAYTNPTVQRFKTDMLDLVNRAKQDLHQTLVLQAQELAQNIKQAAPKRTGHLADSVRVRDISTLDGSKLSVLVIAGGPKTIRRTKSGHSYDYAVGTEFGTHKEKAEPFFFSSYRLYKNGGMHRIEETVQQIVDRNNYMRAARSEWVTEGVSFGFTRTPTVTITHGTPSFEGYNL